MEKWQLLLDGAEPSAGECERTTDQLLEAFVERRDQTAFELIVQRYGSLVFGVCRRILANHHDAEDVFQATFLLLARKAASIRRGETLATWLHRVAYHSALRAKSKVIARKQKEMQMAEIPEPTAHEKRLWPEVERLIDRELDKLPEIYRLPVLLCDIAGKTHKEVGKQLDCAEGTISSRLARAREILATRLKRQGLVIPAAALAVLVSQNAATSAVPGSLVVSTLAAVSATSTASATVSGSLFAKVTALFKSAVQSFLLGKVAMVGIVSSIILAAGAAIQPKENKAPAKVPPKALSAPFDKIANTYRNNYAAIKSLKLVTRPSQETLIDPEVYYKRFKDIRIQPEGERETLVLDGDKVLLNHWRKSKTFNGVIRQIYQQYPERYRNPRAQTEPPPMVTFQEFTEQLPNTPVEIYESIRIFDGDLLLDNGRGSVNNFGGVDQTLRPLHNVQNPSRVKSQEFFYDGGHNYLDLMLYGITGAKVDYDHQQRAKFRMPDLLANEKWRVVADRERLDGADCLVIESSEKNKLWLDRKAGFAVRRWTTGNPISTDREYHDLRHVAADFWMPQSITVTSWLEDDRLPKEFRGKPLIRWRYEIAEFELNKPVPEESFRLAPKPGAIVFDLTLKPLDVNGNPMDSGSYDEGTFFGYYIHPDDPAEIPKVVKAAAIEMGSRLSTAGKPHSLTTAQSVGAENVSPLVPTHENRVSWFVVVNIILLLIGVGYLAFRRRLL